MTMIIIVVINTVIGYSDRDDIISTAVKMSNTTNVHYDATCAYVCLGFKDNMVVAVKTLKDNAGERERLDLVQELQVMKSLEPHPHVVKLLGCCSERGILNTLELNKFW